MPFDIDAVSLKLPTFWTTSPEAWFCHTEAQFAIRGIVADDTKFHYVVAALDSEAANRALSVLTAPPTTGKYDNIKSFLLSAYGLSETERAKALFDLRGLGDSKPSELMDKMLALLGQHTPCFLFKHLFLQQLPGFVRTPLSKSTQSDYRKLAQEADQLYISGSQQVQAIRAARPLTGADRSLEHNSSSDNSVCWYHRKYGNKAKRCVAPCHHSRAFSQSGNGNPGQQ